MYKIFMSKLRAILIVLISTICVAGCTKGTSEQGVFHCYLTWQGDTGTTITVNYHTGGTERPSLVYYDTVTRDGKPGSYSFQVAGSSHRIPWLNVNEGADRLIHVVELVDLAPGETYYFIAGDDESGYTEEKKIQTIPDDEPISFIVGGDIGIGDKVPGLLGQAAAQNPMLALLGGDIAYANGALQNWKNWDKWLDLWEKHMVTPAGYSIPMILAVGNHEAGAPLLGDAKPAITAPFYFGYFAQSGSGFKQNRSSFFTRSLGDSTRLFILDSAHVNLPSGRQAKWLESELTDTEPDINTFAIYHIPLYPSHRGFNEIPSLFLRFSWLETFDNYGLSAAFENHDHMHKRTKPLRGNKPDPKGTVYFGDGCFGKTPRSGDQASRLENPAELEHLGLEENYLASWASLRHFWYVEILDEGEEIIFTAIDQAGQEIDSYTMNPNVTN